MLQAEKLELVQALMAGREALGESLAGLDEPLARGASPPAAAGPFSSASNTSPSPNGISSPRSRMQHLPIPASPLETLFANPLSTSQN